MASWRRGVRRHVVRPRKSRRRYLRFPSCDAGSKNRPTGDSPRDRGSAGRWLVRHGDAHGKNAVSYFTFRCGRGRGRSLESASEPQRARMIRLCIMAALAGAIAMRALAADDAPPPQAFLVREQALPPGPRTTPFLQYQAEQAWRDDDDRRKAWDAIQDQKELLKTQDELRQKLLQMIGGLPAVKTDLHPSVTGKIQMDGFSVEDRKSVV